MLFRLLPTRDDDGDSVEKEEHTFVHAICACDIVDRE